MARKQKVDWRGIPVWARSSYPNGPVPPEQVDWGGEDEELFTPAEWADPVVRERLEQVMADARESWERSFARRKAKEGAAVTRWQTPEEREEMYRRARARALDYVDWDAMDAHEPDKADLAEYLWLAGDLEAAAALRDEYWAELEAEEEAEAREFHERRSAAARKAAHTRAVRRAERAAAVAAAAAILQDARRG
jgi:hypothetical protein